MKANESSKICLVCRGVFFSRGRYSLCGSCQESWIESHKFESPSDGYTVSLRARKQMMDDDSLVESAAASLGMGTKCLPSNRYGGNQ